MKTLLSALFTVFIASSVQASILIAPTQVFFNERDRIQEVTLINTSNEPKTYRLTLVDMLQGPDGRYIKLEEGEQYDYSLQNVIRLSPRQVRLGPGERQSVKLLARNRSQLSDGDYRSHLRFTVLPREAAASGNTSGAGINLDVMINYSIPVILRQGNGNIVAVSITQAKLNDNDGRLAVDVQLNKYSRYSILGSVEIYALDENGSKGETIGLLNGANFFRESESISFNVPLNKNIVVPLNGFIVEYSDTLSKILVAQSTVPKGL